MAINPNYLPTGDVRRYHASKDRAASKGASPKEREQRRLAKCIRKLKKR